MPLRNKIVRFKKIYKFYSDHFLHQNAKRYETRNAEREAWEENVRAKRADFYFSFLVDVYFVTFNYYLCFVGFFSEVVERCQKLKSVMREL